MSTITEAGQTTPDHPSISALRALRDYRIERVVYRNTEAMLRDSTAAQCDVRTLERQVRLHLPSPQCDLSSPPQDAYSAIRAIAIARASRIAAARRGANLSADNYNVSPEMTVTRKGLLTTEGSYLPIEVRPTAPSIGHFYQAEIHYLLAPRADTVLHFGAFEPGSSQPLLYIAVSACDRRYQTDAFQAACKVQRVPLVITRVVGVTNLPKNLVSFTIARVVEWIQASGLAGDLITAINPLVGFTAASMLACGFRPIALAPVRYAYDIDGNFVTNRLATEGTVEAANWPNNILLARPIEFNLAKPVKLSPYMLRKLPVVKKGPSTTAIPTSGLLQALISFRTLLESGWSSRTIHPDFASEYLKGSSKGQCGVSSVWIARRLRAEFSIESTYCYGSLEFDDPEIGSVHRHCWIEIEQGVPGDPFVIDLTADQASGFQEAVIISPKSELVNRGIFYKERIRKGLDVLPNDAVWSRFLLLSDRIDVVDHQVAA